jgi:hypothetical protein
MPKANQGFFVFSQSRAIHEILYLHLNQYESFLRYFMGLADRFFLIFLQLLMLKSHKITLEVPSSIQG